VPGPDGERIARNEQRLEDVRSDVIDVRRWQEAKETQLTRMEHDIVTLMAAHRQSLRAEETRSRRIELRMQWLTVTIALGGLLMSCALVIAAYTFNH
jgi:hypothetical protein